MKRSLWLVPVAVLSFGAFAQEPATKLGFISLEAVLEATSQGQTVLELNRTAIADLRGLQAQLEDYNQKFQVGTLSEADRAQAGLLQQSYNQKVREYQTLLDQAYSDFSSVVNPVIAETAKEQGFSVIMNTERAASSGLVIYADPEETNLTEDVKAKLQPK